MWLVKYSGTNPKAMKKATFITAIGTLVCVFTTAWISKDTASKTDNIPSVTIGNQVWMSENLNVDKFRNGDPIPEVKTKEEWRVACGKKQPAWCYYNNDSVHGAVYGKLYNWYAVCDKRGLAPEGWHVPSGTEWRKLYEYLGGIRGAVGKKLKSTSGWEDEGNGADSYGFNGLAAGVRTTTAMITPNDGFRWQGRLAIWWSTNDPKRYSDIECFVLRVTDKAVFEWHDPHDGFSVRCIKN